MQKPSNIIKHELIGLNIKVLQSTNKAIIGIKGKVVDETKNMFIIKSNDGEKKVPKKENTFEVHLPDGNVVEVKGALLIGRPESRLKNSNPKKRV